MLDSGRKNAGSGRQRLQQKWLWKWLQKWWKSILCVAGSVGLYLALTVAGPSEGPVSEDGKIVREGYGGGEREYQIMVEGLEEQEVPVTVRVSPRCYTKEEADQVFYEIMDGMEERILADNHSLMEVTSDLILPTRLEEQGIRLRWRSSEPDFLTSSGAVKAPVEEAKEAVLFVELSDGRFQGEFELPVRLIPQKLTPQQEQLSALQEEIARADEMQQTQTYLILPDEYKGRKLYYHAEQQNDYVVLPLLGLLMALLLAAREQAGCREQEKRREQELLMDYAELISKLMVFIGAGMTIRSAWERMVKDYEAGRRQGRLKERAAYEEMRRTCYQLVNGTPEGAAYREFGQRCRLQPYLKLSSLLEQNRKAGTKNLRAILQTEMADAFEMRKNLARRMGEEAGTKLLLPLFLMLGIVMVMIMVPAMMTMG